MNEHDDSHKKDTKFLFKNTEEAVKYGEEANYEDMAKLAEKLVSIVLQQMFDISFNSQMLNEASHAFKKDEWYRYYLARKSK